MRRKGFLCLLLILPFIIGFVIMEKEIDAVQSPKLKKCILKISEIGKNAKITASVEGSQNTKKISLIIRLYKKEGDGYVL